jgi:hypothetical protein
MIRLFWPSVGAADAGRLLLGLTLGAVLAVGAPLAVADASDSPPSETGYLAGQPAGDTAEHDEDDDDDDDHDEEAEPASDGLAEFYARYDEEYGSMNGHELAVAKLVRDRNIAIPYEYVSMLMRTPNAFGEGAACVLCHSSNDPEHSYRGLDLTTCDGIKRGSMEDPQRLIFEAGNSDESPLRRYLRNNRMPYGVPFDAPRDTANIRAVRDWIDSGAENDDALRDEVLPLFRNASAFGGFQACTDCHMSNQEPPSFHELDLTSYEGVMLGADSVAHAAEGLPPVPIVIPGDALASPLYQRLVENRMPAGIEPSEDRDHPNMQILMQWIDQGAPCD